MVELKVRGRQTPLRALYEGLIYAAIIEANHQHIAKELTSQYPDRKLDVARPSVAVAAPSDYWDGWMPNRATGDWWPAYEELVRLLAIRLGMLIEIVDLGNIWYEADGAGRPTLTGSLATKPVVYS